MAYELSTELADIVFSKEARDDYGEFVFSYDGNHYRERINMVGFADKGVVLDAGCGFGQWSVALAEVNEFVIGIDRDERCIDIAQKLSAHLGQTNVDFKAASIPPFELDDNSVDAIWCWGVLMFLPRDEIMREFHRVLRPGGTGLLGCCNSTGRWLYKLASALKPGAFNPSVIRASIQALTGFDLTGGQPYSSISRRSAASILAKYGFELVTTNLDGHIDVQGQGRVLPMFPPMQYLFENNIEMIFKKPL